MKTKIKLAPKTDPSDQVKISIPVHYQWSGPDGSTCRGHTVVLAKSRRHARRAVKAFFHTNHNVIPDTIAYAY